MNRAFTRRRTKRTNEANLAVKWKEANYLKKWVKGKDLSYLKKFQRCPELILQEYEKHLNEASPI